MAEDSRNFTLKIITPDRVFFEDEVSMVEFNTVEGEVGIYRGHIPWRWSACGVCRGTAGSGHGACRNHRMA